MKHLSLAALSVLALAGCVVVPVADDGGPPPPPPPPRVVTVPPPEPSPLVWYHGEHAIPDDEGGGWCYEDGAHAHPYFPDRPDVYVVDRGYYTYDGPTIFLYVGGHPLPGGGWCFVASPHQHDYFPPARAGFVWRHGHGYYYEGPYRPQRPAPAAFWPHPTHWRRVPPPVHVPTRPAPAYRPPRNTASPPPPRVVPTSSPGRNDVHDRFDDHGRHDDHGRNDDRKDEHGRIDDRDDKHDHGLVDDRKTAPPPVIKPPPSPARDDGKLDRRQMVEQPKVTTSVAPSQKDHVDSRKEIDKDRKDKVKSVKDDDAKDETADRPARVHH